MYEAKNFEHLLGTPGFSDALLKNHFALYQGYVMNFNTLNDTLVAIEKDGKFNTPEYSELNRRLGWEWNGMRLHELYFSNMTKPLDGAPLQRVEAHRERDRELESAIEKEFGSFEMFQKDFMAMGAMRGIGWVILYHDTTADRLFNVWINEHDVGHFAGATPLLVMDVFEHAFLLDYGLKRADYVTAFWNAIDWRAVSSRLSA